MAYSRESLNFAICLKLEDIDQASGMHKVAFCTTQLAGAVGVAGAILIAPLALEVGAIAAVAGGIFYGISQIMQTKRTGHFLPLPGVPISAGQLTHGFSSIVSSVMGSAAPPAPEEVRLLPTDWLPQRERRINYLLTHCPDLLINAAESAQDGISFAAIVDTALRASEFAISDEQLNNPIMGLKLAGEVRKVLQGDTSGIEAQQNRAIAQEYQRAKAELEAGVIAPDEFAAIEAQVREIAPDVLDGGVGGVEVGAITPVAGEQPVKSATPSDEYRTDWRDVFDLVKDQNLYPAVVVIGAQGLGKTTLVEYLLSVIERRDKIVLDPHYEMGAWPGCRVIGAGMDYQAVGDALANISSDVKERYLQRATCSGYKARPVTLIMEEQTNWAGKVAGAAQFLKESLSDIRKVGYQTISVAHSDTNTARGGAVGTSKMREQGELKIVLLEKGLAEVSLKGREKFKVRYPDPTPYTISMGKPVMADGGDLGPGYIGTDYVDPKPFQSGEQATIDVASSPAAAPASERDRGESFKAASLADSDGMSEVIGWLMATTKPTFSPREARGNKRLRHLTTEQVRSLFDQLVDGVWLTKSADDVYQLAQPI
jgi:hypothetical protein